MNRSTSNQFGLSSNQLKIIALIAMTCDHVGKQLLPELYFLQIIGRLAFPIFAYMIAEGCHYTRNRAKYLLSMLGLAALCQIVYFVAMGSLYQCVVVTFSLSIGMIYLLDRAMKRPSAGKWACAGMGLLVVIFLTLFLPGLIPGTDFTIDFGLWGVLLPVLIYLGTTKAWKIGLMTVGLILLAISMTSLQWYGLLAVPLLILYNGRRGKWRMKYLFYIYYPAHLAAIHLLTLLLAR